MMRLLNVGMVFVLLGSAACAHGGTTKQRQARILIATGCIGVVTGAVVASGCDFDDSGCSNPDTPNLAVGLPIGLLGAGLLIAGVKRWPGKGPSAATKKPVVPGYPYYYP